MRPRSDRVQTECVFHLDERGDVHLSDALAIDFDEFSTFALDDVKERGYVEWRVREGHVLLRLRPSLVSPATYSRLMSWLVGHRPERVLLSYFVGRSWEYEFVRKPGEAARLVRQLIELHGGGCHCNARHTEIPVSSHRNPLPWRSAIDLWRESRETNLESVGRLFDQFFGGRWILYTCYSEQAFEVHSFGRTQSDHVRKWLTTHTKADAERPDRIFSQSCAPLYQRVAASLEPRCDELDVMTDWTGHGRLRSQYRRLVLPFRSAGQTLLLSGIEMDSGIDLLG
jgi:hypothetical protein